MYSPNFDNIDKGGEGVQGIIIKMSNEECQLFQQTIILSQIVIDLMITKRCVHENSKIPLKGQRGFI